MICLILVRSLMKLFVQQVRSTISLFNQQSQKLFLAHGASSTRREDTQQSLTDFIYELILKSVTDPIDRKESGIQVNYCIQKSIKLLGPIAPKKQGPLKRVLPDTSAEGFVISKTLFPQPYFKFSQLNFATSHIKQLPNCPRRLGRPRSKLYHGSRIGYENKGFSRFTRKRSLSIGSEPTAISTQYK